MRYLIHLGGGDFIGQNDEYILGEGKGIYTECNWKNAKIFNSLEEAELFFNKLKEDGFVHFYAHNFMSLSNSEESEIKEFLEHKRNHNSGKRKLK